MTNIIFPRGDTQTNDELLGLANSLTVDMGRQELRLHDGETPGGIPIGRPPIDGQGPFANLILNSNFDLWDLGDSVTYQDRSGIGSANEYSLHAVDQGPVTFSRAPDIDRPGGSVMRVTMHTDVGSPTTGYVVIQQSIESAEVLAGQWCTFSFDARVLSGSGVVATELFQHFGVGAGVSEPVSGIGTVKFNLTSEFERYHMSVKVPSVAGKSMTATSRLILHLWISASDSVAGRNDNLGYQFQTIETRNWTLQAGRIENPVYRPPLEAEEVKRCERTLELLGDSYSGQRHYGVGVFTTDTRFIWYVPFRTIKRHTPTVVLWKGEITDLEIVVGGTVYPVTNWIVQQHNSDGVNIGLDIATTANPLYRSGVVRNKAGSLPPVFAFSSGHTAIQPGNATPP